MKYTKEDFLLIPKTIRYCENLPPNAKLLFGEIANRVNSEGFAVVDYDEFPRLFNVRKKAIYLWISALETKGYLSSRMLRKKKKHFQIFHISIEKKYE